MNQHEELPITAEDYKSRGNKFFQEQNYQYALSDYDKALLLKPDYKEAWLNKGLSHKALKQYDLAKHAVKQALTIDPQYVKAQHQYDLLIRHTNSDAQKSSTTPIPKPMQLNNLRSSNNIPDAQIFFGIADLKLMPDGKIKILEFGRGFQSAFEGYDQLYPEASIIQLLGNTISDIKPLLINIRPNYDESNIAELTSFLKKVQSSAEAKINTKKLESYQGIYGGLEMRRMPPDILHIDNSVVWHIASVEKYITHLLFKDELSLYRPKCMVLPVRYETDLSKRIQATIPGKRYVLKAPALSEGRGVIVVNADELDDYLQLLLFNTADEYAKRMAEYAIKLQMKNPETAFSKIFEKTLELRDAIMAWRASGCNIFFIEEYCASKPVIVSQKTFDATMRVAFALTVDDSVAKFIPLGCYWKLPERPIGEGSLRDHTISSVKSETKLSFKVNEADQVNVYTQLSNCLPNVFLNMLSFNLLSEIQRLQKSTDRQEKMHGNTLFLSYINTLGLLFHYDEARTLLKEVKNELDPVSYLHTKGLFHSHRGNIDKAIIKYNRAHQLNPRDGYTLFSRAQAHAKLKHLDKAIADLNKAKELGFDSILIDIEHAKLRNTKTS